MIDLKNIYMHLSVIEVMKLSTIQNDELWR